VPSISPQLQLLSLDCSSNPITTFRGLPSVLSVQRLIFDDTQLASFTGITPQTGVEVFSCLRSPLAAYQHLALMSAALFGRSLQKVNGFPIPPSTKTKAAIIAPKVRSLLPDGWIIVNVSPLKLLNLETRRRKTIIVNYAVKIEEPVEEQKVVEDEIIEVFEEAPVEEEETDEIQPCDELRMRFNLLQASVFKDLRGPDGARPMSRARTAAGQRPPAAFRPAGRASALN
jgi:hypothetical protein